jgi:hypothetical protein
MEPDLFTSLYARQRSKLDFAETLIPAFEKCGREIGRFNSLRKICRWLDTHDVPPSAKSDSSSKWHPQRLSDYLYMDGTEATHETIREARNHKEGMRVKIRRMFEDARQVLEARPDLVHRWGTVATWEGRLDAHEERIVQTAHRLRRALGK